MKKRRSYKWMILVHCLLPLLAGGIIYILFRRFRFAGIPAPVHLPEKAQVPQLLVNTVPDLCWSYSLAMALFLFALYFSIHRWYITLFVGVLLPGSELIQLLLPEIFTYDLYDLAATLIAFVLSYISYAAIVKTNEKKSN